MVEDDQTPDQLSQLIASLISTSVVESATRQLRTNDPQKIAEQLIEECAATEQAIADKKPLTPIQQLRAQLNTWYDDFYNMLVDAVRDEVLAEVKDSLKMELRMELFTELKSLTENLPKTTTQQSVGGQLPTTVPTGRDFNAGAIPTFGADIGNGIKTPFGGFESVANHFTFGARPKSTKAVEEELMNNPLFARVNKSLDRTKKGDAAYTPEELIDIRRERSGGKLSEEDEKRLQRRMNLANFDAPSEETEEESAKWDMLFKAKYNM